MKQGEEVDLCLTVSQAVFDTAISFLLIKAGPSGAHKLLGYVGE